MESAMTHSNVLDDRARGAVSVPRVGPVLVALKPFDRGGSSIAMARWLSERRHTELQAVGVLEMGDAGTAVAGLPPLSEEYYQRERDEVAADLRNRIASPADQAPVRIDVVEGAPGATIAHIAADRDASTIVIGTGRHGMPGRFLYGERALDVVRSARSVVLVVPPGAQAPIERAIAAVDFSQASVRAAAATVELLSAGGSLTLVHVASATDQPDGPEAGLEEESEKRAGALLARFADALPQSPLVRVDRVSLRGDVAGALLRYAEEQEVDLIACGRRRHSRVQRLLVGSVSTAVIRGAPCSVLVAPELRENDDVHARLPFGETRTSVDPDEWRGLLRGVSDRNAGRRARLSLSAVSPDGVESVDRGYLLLALDYDRRGGRADIVLGDPEVVGTHLTHRIAGVRRIETVTEPDGRDTRIAFTTRSCDCLLDLVDS
jgi:nucleotide-binding universal stress UspA family protein